jgi:hypothetical protein
MRCLISLAAVGLALGTTAVAASPLAATGASAVDAGAMVETVHHKPGHRGGPPWARRGHDGDYRYSRRTVCRTTYQTVFDPYYGNYIRRPVQVCNERYGYRD